MLLNYFLGKRPFLNARVRHERLATLLQGWRSGMATGDICEEFAVSHRTAELPALDHMVGRAAQAGAPVEAAIGPLLCQRPSVSRTTRLVTVSRRSKKTLR